VRKWRGDRENGGENRGIEREKERGKTIIALLIVKPK
jgi:hypothetical protein